MNFGTPPADIKTGQNCKKVAPVWTELIFENGVTWNFMIVFNYKFVISRKIKLRFDRIGLKHFIQLFKTEHQFLANKAALDTNPARKNLIHLEKSQ